jgi:hypothetical protein
MTDENEIAEVVREHFRRRIRILPWGWRERTLFLAIFFAVAANFVLSLLSLLTH